MNTTGKTSSTTAPQSQNTAPVEETQQGTVQAAIDDASTGYPSPIIEPSTSIKNKKNTKKKKGVAQQSPPSPTPHTYESSGHAAADPHNATPTQNVATVSSSES